MAPVDYILLAMDGLPRMLNSSGRSTNRWTLRKERIGWQSRIRAELAQQELGKLLWQTAKVKFTRFSSVRPDYDNLVGGFKGCLDALVLSSVILDDHYDNIGWPEYDWVKAPSKAGCFTIEVWKR